MRHLRHLRLVFALAVTLGASAASAGCVIEVDGFGSLPGEATDQWNRTYTLAPGGSLDIVNVNGSIEVEHAAGTTVEVEAVRTARATTDDEARVALKDLELHEDLAPGKVRIEARQPRMHFMNGRGYGVRFHLRIPDGLHAVFETTNGKVHLEHVAGDLKAKTTNGGVSALAIGGTIDARTTNGGLDIDMANIGGDVWLRTTNGGVTLRVPSQTKASIDVHCVNGGIDIRDFPFNGEHSRRSAIGDLNGGPSAGPGARGPRIDAKTVNGGIRIVRSRT